MIKLLKFVDSKDNKLLLISFVLTFFQICLDISQPFLLSEFFKNFNNNFLASIISKYGILMLLFAFISFLLSSVSMFSTSRIAVRLTSNIRLNLFKKIQSLSNNDINKVSTSSLTIRLTNDLINFQTTLILILRIGARSLFLLVGGIIASFVYSSQLKSINNSNMWWLAFIFLGSILLLSFFVFLIIFFAIKFFKKQQSELDKTNKIIRQTFYGIKIIKIFGLENFQNKIFKDQVTNLKKASLLAFNKISFIFPLIIFFTQGSIVFLLLIASLNIGFVNNGTIASFLTMAFLVTLGVILSVVFLSSTSYIKANVDRINNIFSLNSLTNEQKNDFLIKKGIIEFKNVSFKYEQNNVETLSNISFKCNKNELIAIIGPTGSGKTTLVNLLLKKYDLQNGEILIDNHNIQEINYKNLVDSISIVPQNSILFSGTIKSNLMFGNQNLKNEDLIKATKFSAIDQFILQKKDQFDSIVEQSGNNYSGGQKQRLCIARAILKKSKILILDDATSSLDQDTEKNILNNLMKKKNKTIFLISQKISTIKNADRIIVLDKGKIVGNGNHNQLLKTCKLYKEINDCQFLTKENKSE